jgi:ribulose 1,5-bisphosphate carboxylase large subunit-like protein
MWPFIGFGTGACGRGNATCTAGKLLACRYHEGGADFERESSDDFVRSEDDVSTCSGTHPHGTHVASTSAGHEGVMPMGGGMHDQPGGMSGMAPGAKIASYKVRAANRACAPPPEGWWQKRRAAGGRCL